MINNYVTQLKTAMAPTAKPNYFTALKGNLMSPAPAQAPQSTTPEVPQYVNDIKEAHGYGYSLPDVHSAIDEIPHITDKAGAHAAADEYYKNPGGYKFTPKQMNKTTEFVRPQGDTFKEDTGSGAPLEVKPNAKPEPQLI